MMWLTLNFVSMPATQQERKNKGYTDVTFKLVDENKETKNK